jgi:hypothetical protein
MMITDGVAVVGATFARTAMPPGISSDTAILPEKWRGKIPQQISSFRHSSRRSPSMTETMRSLKAPPKEMVRPTTKHGHGNPLLHRCFPELFGRESIGSFVDNSGIPFASFGSW